MEYTFAEQVKMLLKKRKMTIKELAEKIEIETGMKMSRQNMTQRLTRDNFQEQDMKMIARVLGCTISLKLVDPTEASNDLEEASEKGKLLKETTSDSGFEEPVEDTVNIQEALDQEMTLDEVVIQANEAEERAREEKARKTAERTEAERERIREIARRAVSASHSSAGSFIQDNTTSNEVKREEETQKRAFSFMSKKSAEQKQSKPESSEVNAVRSALKKTKEESVRKEEQKPFNEDSLVQMAKQDAEAAAATRNTADMGVVPDSFRKVARGLDGGPQIDPHTGQEYESNVVRSHPKLKGYIQVYDRSEHKWIDMTEWAFLGFQERKKVMLGSDYKPPIYLD